MTPEEKAIIEAAFKWFDSKKPTGFTTEQHLNMPAINNCTKTESDLAVAVAQYKIMLRGDNPFMEKPKQLETVDLQNLREICQQYLDFVDNDEEYHEDNDYKHYIFEVALEAVFGKDVWAFVNGRRR